MSHWSGSVNRHPHPSSPRFTDPPVARQTPARRIPAPLAALAGIATVLVMLGGSLLPGALVARVLAPGGGDLPTVPGITDTRPPTIAQAPDAAPASTRSGVVIIDTRTSNGIGAGSGVVIGDGSLILTNYHVVADSERVRVTSAGGEAQSATMLGFDSSADVALLGIEKALTPAKIDTDGVETGEALTAIGNPGGEGRLRTVDGQVRATDRSVTVAGENGGFGSRLEGMIETSVPVVPGYSGGAMVDAEGEVVGLSTAGSVMRSASRSDESDAAPDSYAVPIATATEIAAQIEAGDSSGPVTIGRSGYLGVSVDTVGEIVDVVPDSPAAGAGIEPGAVILSVDGTPVQSGGRLSSVLAGTEAGQRVELVWTDAAGEERSSSVALAESPVN